MKTSSLIILTFFTLGCSRKNVVHLSDQHIVNVNKNYIFCNCVFQANKRLAIEQKNSSNQIIKDGSSEVYFIDEGFSVDPDTTFELVSKYLDSLETSGKFISHNNSSLTLAKCLNLYNSKSLDSFVRTQINLNNSQK